jgi:hypothetical protein
MRPSERDQIDLCLDGEAAIVPQPKRGPQEYIVNLGFHPSLCQYGPVELTPTVTTETD